MIELAIEILNKKNYKVYEVKVNKTSYLVLNNKDEWTVLERKELFLSSLPKYETLYEGNYIVEAIIKFIKENKNGNK